MQNKAGRETGNEAISEPHNTVDMGIQKSSYPGFMELMTSRYTTFVTQGDFQYAMTHLCHSVFSLPSGWSATLGASTLPNTVLLSRYPMRGRGKMLATHVASSVYRLQSLKPVA